MDGGIVYHLHQEYPMSFLQPVVFVVLLTPSLSMAEEPRFVLEAVSMSDVLRERPIERKARVGTLRGKDTNHSTGVLFYTYLYLDSPMTALGVSFALSYSDQIDVLGWEPSVSGQIYVPNSDGAAWPASGSGAFMTFSQESHRVCLGRFLIKGNGDGDFTLVPLSSAAAGSPVEEIAVFTSSQGRVYVPVPENVSRIGVGRVDGYDPYEGEIGSKEHSVVIGDRVTVHQLVNPSRTPQWVLKTKELRLVDVEVLDVQGRRVRSWQNVRLEPGNTRLFWDSMSSSGVSVASGIYFLRVRSDDGFVAIKKTTILH